MGWAGGELCLQPHYKVTWCGVVWCGYTDTALWAARIAQMKEDRVVGARVVCTIASCVRVQLCGTCPITASCPCHELQQNYRRGLGTTAAGAMPVRIHCNCLTSTGLSVILQVCA